nr:hypothetical protein [Tanacetum cinerariifolium]
TSDHLGKFDGKADEGYIVGYSASNKAYRVYNVPNKRVEESINLRFLEDKPNVQGLGHEWYFDLDYLTDSLGYKHVSANQPAGTQGNTTNSVGTQDADSDSNCDEQVIIVPSYPSHSIQGTQPLDTPGDKDDDSPFPSADEIFQKKLARLIGEEHRDASYADSPAWGTEHNAEDLHTLPSAQPVPPGCIPVPTGNVPVPTGSIPVPAVATMVPSDDVPVHSSSSTNSIFDGEPTPRFPCPSDLGNHNPSLGIFSSSSCDNEFDTALNNAEEMQQFKFQNVWVLVYLPPGKYAIGTKWILKNKRDAREIVVRNKARLVAQGHRQEKGFVDPQHPKKVYKVVKALYGLHQAPRAWYATLSTFLLKHGYRRGTIDKTLFLKKNNRDIILVQVYVDDIIFGSTKKEWCDDFEALMKGEFQMSDMGELTFFLGLQVQQRPDASRPDIMFAVSVCSRHQVTPTTSNLDAVKKIFKYLKGQPKLGLWYPKESPLVLEAYSDSDYVGSNKDRKSTTGGCQFLGRCLISWQCKKQTIMATSSTEAEYVAVANCCGQPDGSSQWISTFYVINIDQHKHSTILQQSSMAALKYKEEHNKVGYLLKPTGSDEYHQIIDFLSASHIRYALTSNPVIFDSLVKQFWSTATLRAPELGPLAILATIDKTPYTITEDLVRSRLQLADDGGVADLPIPKICFGMDNLGYVTEGKLTFFKNKFSPQWRLFNWSNYIFRGMVSNIRNAKKFLIYPRFLQTIMGIETRVTRQYKVLAFSSKLFANMKLNFVGDPMTLLPAMLLQAQAGGGAEVAEQAVPHPMPSPDHSPAHFPTPFRPQTSDPVAQVLEHDHSFDQHETAAGSFPSREDAPLGGDLHPSPPRSSHAPPAAELHDHKKLFKDVVGKLVKKVKTLEVKLKTKKRKMVVSDSDQEDCTTQNVDLDALVPWLMLQWLLIQIFPLEFLLLLLLFLLVLLMLLLVLQIPKVPAAVPADSPKVHTVGPTDSPNVPAGVSSKGKTPMVEEDIPFKARTFRQMEEDRLGEEAAKRLHEEKMAEIERERVEAHRKRQQEVLESTKFYNKADWLNIRAQVEANASLLKTLLGDDMTEANFPAHVAVLIKKKRQALAEQLFRERQNRPLTLTQQKAYMRQYVKNQSSVIYNTGWTMSYVKSFSDEQLIQEFEKIRKVQSQSQIKAFSRTLKRPGPVLEEPSTKRPKSPEAPTPSMPEDSDDEDSVDEVWSAVVGWELFSTPLGEINALYHIDGSTKHFTTLRQILHLVDRHDLMKLYGLVVQYYEHHPAVGVGLLFWGDLQVLFDSQAGGKGSFVWNNQHQWEIRSWRLYTLSNVHVLETVSGEVLSMFTDVSYSLLVELMKKMLMHKLEIDLAFVGNDLTTVSEDYFMLLVQGLAIPRVSSNLVKAYQIYSCCCGDSKFAVGSRYVVPTGRVIVPTGRYIVPTGRVIVTTGRYVVPADISFCKQESLLCLACDYTGYSPSLTGSKDLSSVGSISFVFAFKVRNRLRTLTPSSDEMKQKWWRMSLEYFHNVSKAKVHCEVDVHTNVHHDVDEGLSVPELLKKIFDMQRDFQSRITAVEKFVNHHKTSDSHVTNVFSNSMEFDDHDFGSLTENPHNRVALMKRITNMENSNVAAESMSVDKNTSNVVAEYKNLIHDFDQTVKWKMNDEVLKEPQFSGLNLIVEDHQQVSSKNCEVLQVGAEKIAVDALIKIINFDIPKESPIQPMVIETPVEGCKSGETSMISKTRSHTCDSVEEVNDAKVQREAKASKYRVSP